MFDRVISSKQEVAAAQNIKERDYWLDKLSGDLVRSSFPTDIQDNSMSSAGTATVEFELKGDVYERAMRLCNRYDQVLHMILLAGVTGLLNRYTGHRDIIIGVPIYKQEMEGEFINTILAIRSRLSADTGFKEFLVQIRQTMIEATENQNYPIESLLYKLKPAESGGGFALFDTVVLLENIHDERYISHVQVNTVFSFNRKEDSIGGTIRYNRQLYRRSKMERLSRHFTNLLSAAMAKVDARLLDIEILSPEEKHRILYEFNDTAAMYSSQRTLHSLFEEQATKDGDAVAAISEKQHISYRKLNERANQLAAVLGKKGVGGGELVAVVMGRSNEMVISVMGILKAGGAYVPLEPDLPETRIYRILSCLGVRCLVTDCTHQRTIAELVKELLSLHHIVLFTDNLVSGREILSLLTDRDIITSAQMDNLSVDNFVSTTTAGDMAYVIYTSGSTGIPKGVMERHRPVVNVIEWVNRTFQVGHGDKLQFVASLGFDLSVYDIFGILAAGGALHVVSNSEIREPQCLMEMIIREGITFWDSAPATLQQLVPFFQEARENPRCSCFRLVFLSGDWIPVTLPDVLRETFPGVKVISLGGATEATIWSNFYPIGEVNPYWKSIPYGRPIQNAKYYILDPYLKVAPLGVPGDLFIGGQCLASGYINDVRLTSGKFIDNPFVEDEVIYRTGDIARWFDDGNMEFLGRKDFQVKIRGHRIELGEIEAKLLKHPDIETVILTVKEDPKGDKFICAYIVSGREIGNAELRTFLSEELPEYMVPAHFVTLDQIPLTPSGKIDRKALPEPLSCADESFTAPENDRERKLAHMWAEVLGIEVMKIGIDTNFFDLGGHSLNASELVSRMHRHFNVRVPLAEIFRLPTIRELVDYIASSTKELFQSIVPAERKTYYPLSAAQKGIYLTQQLDKSSTAYNMPFVMHLEGAVDLTRMEDVFRLLISRHESLRIRFRLFEHEPVQEVLQEVDFSMEYREMSGPLPESLIDQFIRSFDLETAPLLRAGLVQIDEDHYLLMFDVHHIVADGTSIQILRNEFIRLYAGEPLPSLRIQYKDYSLWQHRQRGGQMMSRQRDYWLKVFHKRPPVTDVPTDFPRPSVQRYEGSALIFEIGSQETAALNTLASEIGCTLFMVMLAAYNVLLMKLSGAEDIVVGTGTAGRRHADVSQIIGLFMNTLALRNSLSREMMFSTFLQNVKRTTLDAFENQDYAFDQLLQDLKKKEVLVRDTSRNPLFDTMFALENYETHSQENETIELHGLKISPYDFEYKTSKFDWFFIAYEIDDQIKVFWEYSTVLFKESTIDRIKDYYLEIVDQVVRDKHMLIKDIEISDRRLDVKSEIDKEEFENFGF